MTRHDKNDAGRFFETASKEELIDYLVKTIHNEVSKGDDADCDLVRECSDWLDELTEDEIVFTPEELERNLEKIKAKTVSDKPVKIRKKVAWKKFVRVALIAAVIFTISLLSLSAVAANQGYDSMWEYIIINAGKLLGMNQGEELDGDGITVIKNTGTVKYGSMEELLESESLDVLYPHVMPNNIRIIQLQYIHSDDNHYTLYLLFSNNSYTFDISNYYSVDVSNLTGFDSLTINELDIYIAQKEDGTYFALLQKDGYEYTIKSPNYDNLIIIINNMKG